MEQVANEVANKVANEVANKVANEVANKVANKVANEVANKVAKEKVLKKEKQKDNQKSKEERVKEGIHLLKQLINAGVQRGGSLEELKEKIDDWIKTGDAWTGKVHFEEYKRVAEVTLPSKNGVSASLIFRVQK
jgi:hypothetical protein